MFKKYQHFGGVSDSLEAKKYCFNSHKVQSIPFSFLILKQSPYYTFSYNEG